MAYVIEFYRNDRRMGVKPWPGDLATAKDHALNYMPVHNATHVTVIDDETKQIIFSYGGGGNEQGT